MLISRVKVMVFNVTFNNISVISWWSVLLVEETRKPGENHQPFSSILLVMYSAKYYCFVNKMVLSTYNKPSNVKRIIFRGTIHVDYLPYLDLFTGTVYN
jgi:hypothetical protein